MSDTPDTVVPVDVRPLPPRPNLEFEHKTAKELLRSLKDGDLAALARAHAQRCERTDYQLADAQFVIAREYGFASWPKLVAYFTTWDRHVRAQAVRATYRPHYYEDRVRQAIDAHKGKLWSIGPTLATYVPRFYGKSDQEIFAAPFSEDEARVMVARREGFAGWNELLAAAEKVSRAESDEFPNTPFGRAQAAINAGDIDAVKAIVGEHPELLRPATSGLAEGGTIISQAVRNERISRSAVAREITDWLASQGGDLQDVLNKGLTGYMRATREDLEFLVARGADTNWAPPNGMSILEHLLLRCWNPGPADVIARYVKPRSAFWIAAGMNDVKSMQRYFNRDGSLTDAARNDRPDFTAVGLHLVARPDVDDREIMWEAALVAAFNHRFEALDLLYERGLPIDYSPYRSTLLHWAVGNRIVPVVEFLVKRGASLELRGWQPNASAREMASSNLEDMPNDPDVKRIFEICGG